jgi:hypothetical protein
MLIMLVLAVPAGLWIISYENGQKRLLPRKCRQPSCTFQDRNRQPGLAANCLTGQVETFMLCVEVFYRKLCNLATAGPGLTPVCPVKLTPAGINCIGFLIIL